MIHWPLKGRTSFLYVVTILSLLGTAVLTAVLFTSTHAVCSESGCRNVTNDSGPAWIALIVGLVQTVLLLTIAQLTQVLGHVVDRVNRGAR